MIKKQEIKKIVNREISSFLEPLNYQKGKISKEIISNFEKETTDYYQSFGCYIIKYDEFKLIYGFDVGINKIVRLLEDIDKIVPLQTTPYKVGKSIVGISPSILKDPLNPEGGYKYFNNSDGLREVIKEIKQFYYEQYLPFYEKFCQVNKLDEEFNSFNNFYTTGWGKFPTLPFFHTTRLIIARLANNPDYEKVVEKNFEALEHIWEQDGLKYDRLDETKPEVFAAKYLRDLKV